MGKKNNLSVEKVGKKTKSRKVQNKKPKNVFPEEFPFWARFKKNKNRTTLVIDDEVAINKKTKKPEDMFVHRETTHTYKKEYQEIDPNPDIDDPDPMYLKRPRKHPKRMFGVHNKNLNMPNFLKEQYSKNNKKINKKELHSDLSSPEK